MKRQVPVKDLADRAKAYGIAQLHRGRQRRGGGVHHREGGGGARAGRRRADPDRGQVHAHAWATRSTIPAEYVPKDMFEYWKQRDPIVLYEKFLTGEKLLDAKSKKEIESGSKRCSTKERDFAESSPMPPPGVCR